MTIQILELMSPVNSECRPAIGVDAEGLRSEVASAAQDDMEISLRDMGPIPCGNRWCSSFLLLDEWPVAVSVASTGLLLAGSGLFRAARNGI
jgi:hypothetical protein